MSHLHTNEDNTISFDSIVHFLRSIASDHSLSTEVLEILLEQFEGLRLMFGDKIPRDDVLQIISHQIEVTRTGKIREPVDIVEFVESPEYMGQGKYIRYPLMEHLIRLHAEGSAYFEVVLGGGIGLGKNYFTDLSLGFDIYKLSCLYSPQAYYNMAPGSKIVFVHQSKTEKLAKEVVFEHFGARLDRSGYFPKFFPYDPKFKKVMKFPNQVDVLPISSADTSALGMNVFGAVIDEMNFFERVKKSKKAQQGEETYDKAEVLYRTIVRRMESRFQEIGKLPGKLYLISSANFEGDFIDRKEKEAETSPHIFVMHMALWEAFMQKDGTLNPKKYSGKFFFVRKPTETAVGGVYEEEPGALDEEDAKNILKVPVEHKESFERDMIGSLRDIAGVAVTHTSRFINKDFIELAFTNYFKIYGKDQIFRVGTTELLKGENLQDMLNIDFLRRLSPFGPFAVHIDLSVSQDCAGIGVGHVIGSKEVSFRSTYNKESGQFTNESRGSLPIYGIPGLLQVVPPKGGEIDIDSVRDLVGIVCSYIPVYWLTMDRFQSTSTLQYFRGRGISTGITSMDRSPEPYNETKFAIKEERAYIARHDVLLTELPSLDQDNTTGKIDHPESGSKDLSDSLAGAIYDLSLKKASYRIKHAPRVLPATIPVQKANDTAASRRPSSGRVPLYG